MRHSRASSPWRRDELQAVRQAVGAEAAGHESVGLPLKLNGAVKRMKGAIVGRKRAERIDERRRAARP